MENSMNIGDVTMNRIIYSNGRIAEFSNTELALKVYYALPSGVRCAFRGAGDVTPVYTWDCVDKG
jgi:hypothetical protein